MPSDRRYLSFFVPGIPVPQGSKVASCRGGRPSMREAATGHADARKRVTLAAKEAMKDNPDWDRIQKPLPVFLVVEFTYMTPPSRKSFWGGWRTVIPDVDKLVRLIGDSLKDAGVFDDDGQISVSFVMKHESETAINFGTYVIVSQLRIDVAEFKQTHAWPHIEFDIPAPVIRSLGDPHPIKTPVPHRRKPYKKRVK